MRLAVFEFLKHQRRDVAHKNAAVLSDNPAGRHAEKTRPASSMVILRRSPMARSVFAGGIILRRWSLTNRRIRLGGMAQGWRALASFGKFWGRYGPVNEILLRDRKRIIHKPINHQANRHRIVNKHPRKDDGHEHHHFGLGGIG